MYTYQHNQDDGNDDRRYRPEPGLPEHHLLKAWAGIVAGVKSFAVWSASIRIDCYNVLYNVENARENLVTPLAVELILWGAGRPRCTQCCDVEDAATDDK